MMAMRASQVMTLADLLAGAAAVGATNPTVSGLALDSREVRPGDCFIALSGARDHGIRHAASAAAAGAVAVLTEDIDVLPRLGIPVLCIDHLRRQVGEIAARFYGHPARSMSVIAVTGTNGKTTVAHVCADALQTLHGRCGYFGTLGSGLFGALEGSVNTTPEPLLLQRSLAALRGAGCAHVALEASSHALDQGRLNGLDIGVAVFTGLGHDHLDYHGTLENYGRAKQRLFSHAGLHTAVVNVDDGYAPAILAAITPGVRVLTYGMGAAAHVQAVKFDCHGHGSRIEVQCPEGRATLDSALVGDFNVQNLLAALSALLAIGVPLTQAAAALSAARPVRGRLELAAGAPRVYVDYAHSPDSLARVLATVRALTRGRVICVFGCGGDRDASKRPLMGAIAERDADRVFVTADNPRTEDPADIAAQILAGMRAPADGKVQVVPERADAIAAAVAAAGKDDAVLIAGKGHETTQTTGQDATPFDDVAVVRRLLGMEP